MAEQAADHGAADYVVLREAVAAHGGDAALGDGRLIRGNFASILRVGFADGADRADSHAVKIGARLGGIALKIAVQRAIALGGSELVSGRAKWSIPM